MAEDILNPEYWKKRLNAASADRLHEAVFRCPKERWEAIEAKHREILARHVKRFDAVLDCGCGWGRLLTMLPDEWFGLYLGVDLSPDFIHKALTETVPYVVNRLWGNKNRGGAFKVADLRTLSNSIYFLPGKEAGKWEKWDWAVMISVRPMVRRNLGGEVWDQMESEIRKCAEKLLYLEYDPEDEGSVE